MMKMIYPLPIRHYFSFVFLLVLIFDIGLGQNTPPIPCPQYFSYQHNGNELIGVIQVKGPPVGSPLQLNIIMTVGASLQSSYSGTLELSGTQEEAFQRLLENKPLIYFVKFPSGIPIPQLMQILYNNQVICDGPSVLANFVTTIKLEHMLATRLNNQPLSGGSQPVQNNFNLPNSQNSFQPVIIQTPIQQTSVHQQPVQPQITRPVINNNNNIPQSNDCGVLAQTFLSTPLVLGGEEIQRGTWPWLVAIYKVDVASETFNCGGNLVSANVVVSAAHCFVQNGRREVIRSNFRIKLGRYDLNQWQEDGMVVKNCREIAIHPDYMKVRESYDADIAVVVLDSPVSFSDYIRPICLWSGNSDQNAIVGMRGTIVGWGKTEFNRISPIPKKVEQPVVAEGVCLRSSEIFNRLTSPRTFCAGDKSGDGPCSGDSGGGLAIAVRGRWMLRGTVSASLAQAGLCDLSNYVVYCDVAKFIGWIQQYM